MVWKKVKNTMGELIHSDHPRKDDEEIDISVLSAEHGQYAVKHAWHHKYMESLMRYWAGTQSEIASVLCPGWDQSCVQPCKTPIRILHINEPSYLRSVTRTWNYDLDFFLMQWLRVKKNDMVKPLCTFTGFHNRDWKCLLLKDETLRLDYKEHLAVDK